MQSLSTLIGCETPPRLTSKINSARHVRSATFVPSTFAVRDLLSSFIACPDGIIPACLSISNIRDRFHFSRLRLSVVRTAEPGAFLGKESIRSRVYAWCHDWCGHARSIGCVGLASARPVASCFRKNTLDRCASASGRPSGRGSAHRRND